MPVSRTECVTLSLRREYRWGRTECMIDKGVHTSLPCPISYHAIDVSRDAMLDHATSSFPQILKK
jgi:hypothetical protein